MSLCVPLSHPLSPKDVGNKFANLGRVAEMCRVPAAVCVTMDAYSEALGPDRLRFLGDFFADLRATMGCFLISSIPALSETLEELALPEYLRNELRTRLLEVFGSLDGREFAVRSSGSTEDSGQFSFAGVYKTTLGVEGFDGIRRAIVECWKSYFTYPAIAARIRADDYDPCPSMAVIVQEMVDAELSGVAFTDYSGGGRVVVECVKGLGEDLVSGLVAPQTHCFTDSFELATPRDAHLSQVRSAALKLRDVFGHDVDVEWAWNSEGLHILQARPITVRLGDTASSEPFFNAASLYLDDALPQGMDLGDTREIYTYYVTKRADAYRLAASSGITTGAANLLGFNGAGLVESEAALKSLLDSSKPEQVVLDISSNIRQVIVRKDGLLDYLRDTFALTPIATQRHTLIMRDFIRGQYGFISRLVGNSGCLVEYSLDGLMNINRGIAHCARIYVEDIDAPLTETSVSCDDPKALSDFGNALPDIVRFTRLLNGSSSDTQLEWVLDGGVPCFVDFSREQGEVTYREELGSVVVSPGTARGPVLRLEDADTLYRLSIGPAVSLNKPDRVLEHEGLQALIDTTAAYTRKPIVCVPRPYTILSTLFEHVAGFVFAEGSLLCHLAILLREAGLPAVICPSTAAAPGDEVVISDGQLTISSKESSLI